MSRKLKFIALILSISLYFCALSAVGYAEESTVDPTVYNESSMILSFVMEPLISKSYADIMENVDDYKPMWLLARDIIINKEYNEGYNNTKTFVEAFYSNTYAIKNIRAALIVDYSADIYNMYTEIFATERTSADVLARCIEIESYMVHYADLITVDEQIESIAKFCTSTIEKIKKDTAEYNGILGDNLYAFSQLATRLSKAGRAQVLEEYPELHRLYLSTYLGNGASAKDITLYRQITRSYAIYSSANECFTTLTSLLSANKGNADELYFLLCASKYMLSYADATNSAVKSGKTVYQQKLNAYENKYVSHNEPFIELNRFAGSISADSGIIPSPNKKS